MFAAGRILRNNRRLSSIPAGAAGGGSLLAPQRAKPKERRKFRCYMPFMWSALLMSCVGFVIILSGTAMCVVGYTFGSFASMSPPVSTSGHGATGHVSVPETSQDDQTLSKQTANSTGIQTPGAMPVPGRIALESEDEVDVAVPPTYKGLIYAGPVVMSFGCFAIVFACVVVCETRDRAIETMDERVKRGLPEQPAGGLRVDFYNLVVKHRLLRLEKQRRRRRQRQEELNENESQHEQLHVRPETELAAVVGVDQLSTCDEVNCTSVVVENEPLPGNLLVQPRSLTDDDDDDGTNEPRRRATVSSENFINVSELPIVSVVGCSDDDDDPDKDSDSSVSSVFDAVSGERSRDGVQTICMPRTIKSRWKSVSCMAERNWLASTARSRSLSSLSRNFSVPISPPPTALFRRVITGLDSKPDTWRYPQHSNPFTVNYDAIGQKVLEPTSCCSVTSHMPATVVVHTASVHAVVDCDSDMRLNDVTVTSHDTSDERICGFHSDATKPISAPSPLFEEADASENLSEMKDVADSNSDVSKGPLNYYDGTVGIGSTREDVHNAIEFTSGAHLHDDTASAPSTDCAIAAVAILPTLTSCSTDNNVELDEVKCWRRDSTTATAATAAADVKWLNAPQSGWPVIIERYPADGQQPTEGQIVSNTNAFFVVGGGGGGTNCNGPSPKQRRIFSLHRTGSSSSTTRTGLAVQNPRGLSASAASAAVSSADNVSNRFRRRRRVLDSSAVHQAAAVATASVKRHTVSSTDPEGDSESINSASAPSTYVISSASTAASTAAATAATRSDSQFAALREAEDHLSTTKTRDCEQFAPAIEAAAICGQRQESFADNNLTRLRRPTTYLNSTSSSSLSTAHAPRMHCGYFSRVKMWKTRRKSPIGMKINAGNISDVFLGQFNASVPSIQVPNGGIADEKETGLTTAEPTEPDAVKIASTSRAARRKRYRLPVLTLDATKTRLKSARTRCKRPLSPNDNGFSVTVNSSKTGDFS